MKQQTNERFADYVIRLKQQASECGFDRYGAEVGQILTNIYLTDAVVEGCTSNEVRKTILLKDLPFPEIEMLGVSQEGVELQVEEIAEGQRPGKTYRVTEQRVDRRKNNPGGTGKPQGRNCFNCGRLGHISVSASCPARGKQCHNCKSFGHFEKLCRKPKRYSERLSENKQIRSVEATEMPDAPVLKDPPGSPNQDKVYYAFYTGNELNVLPCVIGGVKIDMLVDSGADANLITAKAWSMMKEQRISIHSSEKGTSRMLRGYGSDKPLTILGCFIADVTTGSRTVRAEFLVVEEGQRCLLGDKTAKQLGVLRIGMDIGQVIFVVELEPSIIGGDIVVDRIILVDARN
nr:uncharacterized protein LOC109404680 [Aedes albopictus]